MRPFLLKPMQSPFVAVSVAILAFACAAPALVDVKWFAPYIVQAKPQSVGLTLTDPWFWTGIVLVHVFCSSPA